VVKGNFTNSPIPTPV